MRVVVSARGVLYVEIADDRWTAAGPSWVKEDHLEIWLAATGTSTPPGDACEIAGSATTNPARQWGIRISDGAVFPGFGSPAPLAGVEVARAGSVARIKVPLQGFADSEVPDLTVVYSDSDDGLRQERLIATSDVERGHIDSLGHVRVVEPAEATCAADSRKKALHIVRTPLRTRWNKAIAQ
jgi:hypothetical protein